MAQFFEIHPETPQRRLILRVVDIIREGGIVAYPTDSSYALACHIGDKTAMDKIRRIRQLDDKHNFTLLCKDLAQVSNFTKIGNEAYRLIKALTPGPFTFILEATREVPRRLQHPKKKTIGIRITEHPIAMLLAQELEEPLLTSSLILPGATDALTDPYDIKDALDHELDAIIDAGNIASEQTTVIEITASGAAIIRQGKGIASMLD
ncbi:MAG: L-threonylcarbamoyladenylate synthase [Methylococcaceae bacterium]|jgi:tRNA threonylcarbamoyl adenosine modification protein (Sua5/YciO/YrdC/YwlC family)|nr:L-threonylcarbamoyladenylate synthase [Methylococcaceae bacterium]MDZ4156689.1 L-threonylcarbamoyladenylate synthase [Methylococcales bacterium]MDP2394839.1 L-threonylcarbamoyladenylate synthase [Methylococcaceae bacterium]MDP3020260.1 L-threonylcarbamoyladenylate synthase [Methylococcaceae bacterium]MDP3390801.1 L-threonylcarbamoyladenylate synthase [Methylococcaceae bacterium]